MAVLATPAEPRWLSIELAAHRCSVSQVTLRRWLARGILRRNQAGRRVLIDVRELDKLIEQGVG